MMTQPQESSPNTHNHTWSDWQPTEKLDDLEAELLDGLELPRHRTCQAPDCTGFQYDPNTPIPVGYAGDGALFCLGCAHTMYDGYPVKDDASQSVDYNGDPLGTIYSTTIWPAPVACQHCGQHIECQVDPNPLHMVNAFFTQHEYQTRRLHPYPNPLQNRVQLQAYSVPAQQTFSEQDIPQILLDAARTLPHLNTEDFEPRTYDTSNWPLGLKTAIMATAAQDWFPNPGHTRSPWNEYRPAHQLFKEHPELEDAFSQPPAVIAQAWTTRNPRPRSPQPNLRIRDFNHPAMVWSMYDDSSHRAAIDQISATIPPGADEDEAEAIFESNRNLLKEAYDNQLLKLEAPEGLPDGLYKFSIPQNPGISTGYGVVIRDGRFEPELTSHAIFLAQAGHHQSPSFDHVYIERLLWNGDFFEVSIGS